MTRAIGSYDDMCLQTWGAERATEERAAADSRAREVETDRFLVASQVVWCGKSVSEEGNEVSGLWVQTPGQASDPSSSRSVAQQSQSRKWIRTWMELSSASKVPEQQETCQRWGRTLLREVGGRGISSQGERDPSAFFSFSAIQIIVNAFSW